MVKRNRHLQALKQGYLFPEIERRKAQFHLEHPDIKLFNLGIGNTTQPLPESIAEAMSEAARLLATEQGYRGYGPEIGSEKLREKISQVLYGNAFSVDEVLISDGVNSDISRLQILFGSEITVAVLDPAYPVYVDGSIIHGVKRFISLPTSPENAFFPDLTPAIGADLIYFCSPNNPTGVAATRDQLQELVDFAREHHIIIIYDAAYSQFIQDKGCPQSIYEIEGAEEVAIELGSFSKFSGFTGVRLSWSVVPNALRYEGGGSVLHDWTRLVQTSFNGPSLISEAGGLAVLSEEGLQACQQMNLRYLENTKWLKVFFQPLADQVYGGENSPYLWAHFAGQSSWDVFQKLLDEHQLLTIPGSGFGPSGNGFIRVSGFCHHGSIQELQSRMLEKATSS